MVTVLMVVVTSVSTSTSMQLSMVSGLERKPNSCLRPTVPENTIDPNQGSIDLDVYACLIPCLCVCIGISLYDQNGGGTDYDLQRLEPQRSLFGP